MNYEEELHRLRLENAYLKGTISHMECIKELAQERAVKATARMHVLEAEVGRLRSVTRRQERDIITLEGKLRNALREHELRASVATLPDAVVRVLHSE